jgi:hypothetical protein
VASRISRGAEDRETRRRAGSGETNERKEEDMLFGRVHPAIRAAVGVVLLVIGLTLHMVLVDATGAAAIVISVVQWLRRRQETQGPAR